MLSKFRGKYLQIIPLGISHLVFSKFRNHYTWHKVTTTVNDIILGKLWVDNHGDIVSHLTHDICQLKYYLYSYFSNQTAGWVVGVSRTSAGVIRYSLDGSWDDKEGVVLLSGTVPALYSKDKTTGESVSWEIRFHSCSDGCRRKLDIYSPCGNGVISYLLRCNFNFM